MKKLLMILMTMISLQSFAQGEMIPPIGEDPVTRSVPEDSMAYLRTGQTVGSFNSVPTEVIMNSAGYLRYAENFIYGIEYNSFYSDQIQLRTTNLQGLIGYRVLWNKRFLPYALFQFGQASLKDESGQDRYRGTGIAVTIDAGVDLIKIWRAKGSFGIRHTDNSYNNASMPKASFTDLYFMTGIVF